MGTPAVTPDPYASIAERLPAQSADPYAAIAKPIAAPVQPGNIFTSGHPLDTFKANVAEAQQGAQPGDGTLMGALKNFGAGAADVIHSVGHTVLHPIDTVVSAARAQEAQAEKPVVQQLKDLVTSGQILGIGGQTLVNTAKGLVTQPARTLGQVGTGAVMGEIAAPIVSSAIDAAPNVPQALTAAKDRFVQTAYPQNVSIPASEAATQNFIKALVPDKAAVPNIKSAASEIPDVLASAENNGTQINGKLDAAQAIRTRANEIQAHYDNNILRPNAGEVSTVPDDYSGDTAGAPNRATLGQINDRVDSINSELKSNFRKKVASQTTEANASDAALIAEKQGLTDILHQKLADLTGLQPEDIAGLRQRAGKLRSLAQEVEVSADRDSLMAGTRQTSGGTLSIKNPIEGVIDKASGGQEIIGNRVFKQALGNFTPAETPLPQPKPPGPGVATTPAMAQQEFLRANQLEQAAQDASAQRGQQASATRMDNRVSNADRWASEGYTNVVNHLANDSSSGLARADLVKVAQTPKGNGLLVRASDLTPGSPQMRSLVQQIKTLVGQ